MSAHFAICKTWALMLVCLLFFACRKDTHEREFAGDPPVGKVIQFGRRIVVSAAPQASWKDLANLEIFNGFWPGITIEEAKREFGKPAEVARNHYGPYSVYRRSGGTLHVAWEEHRSGKDAYKTWTLRAYPDATTSAGILHPSISKYIEPGKERVEVVIMNSGDEPAIDITVRWGKVETMTWIRR